MPSKQCCINGFESLSAPLAFVFVHNFLTPCVASSAREYFSELVKDWKKNKQDACLVRVKLVCCVAPCWGDGNALAEGKITLPCSMVVSHIIDVVIVG